MSVTSFLGNTDAQYNTPTPTPSPSPTITPTIGPGSVVFAVNCAGPSFTASDDVYYEADRNYSGGQTANTGDAIANTNTFVIMKLVDYAEL